MRTATAILALAPFLAALPAPAAGKDPDPPGPPGIVFLEGMAVDLLDPSLVAGARIVKPPLVLPIDAAAIGQRARPLDTPSASQQERIEAERHLERAIAYLRQNDAGKAMLELRDALTYDPNDARILARAAVVCTESRDYERAAGYFKRYLELAPNDLPMTGAFVAILLRMSRFDEAQAILAETEKTAPDFMPLAFSRVCLRLIREERTADRTFWTRRSLSDVHSLVQWLKVDHRDLLRIMGPDDYRILSDVTLGPNTLRSLDEIATELQAAADARTRGDYKTAITHWRRAQELGVDAYGLEAAIAESYETSGDVPKALEVWDAVTERHALWPQVWLSYGHVLLRTGNFRPALDATRKAKELAPDMPVVDFLLASALAMNDQIPEAQRTFNSVVRRDPKQFRQWLDSDGVFQAALDRMPNRAAILRTLEIPPESQN